MRLLACISHHGYGHLAQSAPVLNALTTLRPDVHLIVRSVLPHDRLAARIRAPFEHLPAAADCGLHMRDALRVDVPASLTAYGEFHRDWEARVLAEARWLASLEIRAVFSNVAYLPLAAARLRGLPSVGLCSLNWADIFAHCFAESLGNDPGPRGWLAQMRAAYGSATAFLRPEPSMAMEDLPHRVAIPPIAARGRAQAAALRQRLMVSDTQRLVLIGMGGVAYRPPMEGWPPAEDIVWLVPDEWAVSRRDARPFSATGLSFIDMLASSDALVTKPGYGSFTEAAVHGLPVLYLPRWDWPESAVLETWLHAHTRAAPLDEAVLSAGGLAEPLRALWRVPAPPCPPADGAEAAARYLSGLLV